MSFESTPEVVADSEPKIENAPVSRAQEINDAVQRELKFSLPRAANSSVAKIVNINAPGSLSRGWPRCWDRLTYTDRTPVDTVAEGIDNPASEMAHFGPISVEIEIGADWVSGQIADLDTAWLRIRDNGPGISIERLEQCLALGELARETADSLHEHGVGMKTMLLMFCRSVESLRYIVTKGKNDSHGYRFSYYDPAHQFGEIPVRYDTEIFAENEHGTEFYIVGLSDKGIYRRRHEYTRNVVEQLGFKYARLLSGETFHGHKLAIRLRLCNKDGTPLIGKDGSPECDWQIQPVVQRYRGAERPNIDQEKIEGPGSSSKPYSAILTFGRAAQDKEYKAAGLDSPGTHHPCHQYKRQLHIVMHGKVITSLDIGAFGGDPNSCTYVPYTGVLTLISGFSTTYEKNGIVNDSNWQELCARVLAKVQPLIDKWSQEYPQEEKDRKKRERKIRDAYADRLRLAQAGSDKKPVAHTEYAVEGSGGAIDILFFADENDKKGLVIEVKPDVADGQDVMQAFGYVFMSQTARKDRCELVAADFSTGAKVMAKQVEKKLGVKVELITIDSLKLKLDS
jgi:hypothetical protein